MDNKIPDIKFELFRYQLLPITQHIQVDMFRNIVSVDELKKIKNELFNEVLKDFPTLIWRKSALNHRIDLHSEPWTVIEINTQKTLQREKQDFEKENLDTWPHVVVIINNDPNIQLIAISKNTKAFSSSNVVTNILKENLQPVLNEMLLNIEIEAIFEKIEFWNIVKENADKIRSVNFELVSPNMANISGSLELDLAKLNADTNSHRTNLKLNSSEGGILEINPENSLLQSLVEYASEGGGDIEVSLKGYKEKIKTSKSVKKTSVDEITLKNLTLERLELLLKKINIKK